MTPEQLKTLVRTVPNFPSAGIQFRDITTLINHGEGFAATVRHLAAVIEGSGAARIVGMEARGFIFGAAVAAHLKMPFVPIRKPGKLPVKTLGVDYALEYGSDRLELDASAFTAGERVAIVDDLIATGGTALAAVKLLNLAGVSPACAAFVIGLPGLGGAAKLRDAGVSVDALMTFEGD